MNSNPINRKCCDSPVQLYMGTTRWQTNSMKKVARQFTKGTDSWGTNNHMEHNSMN